MDTLAGANRLVSRWRQVRRDHVTSGCLFLRVGVGGGARPRHVDHVTGMTGAWGELETEEENRRAIWAQTPPDLNIPE